MIADAEQLYLEHEAFIKRCATKLVRRFSCPQLFDDLMSAGTVAFLEHLDGYDESRNVAPTTYLYPHVIGAQWREVENSLTAFSLSKRTFQALKQAGFLSATAGLSLDAQTDEDESSLAERLPSPELPLEIVVYQKICIELVRAVFENELSYKEREILGSFFGVFGINRKTLAEIGEAFNMKESATLKAKAKALQKLTDLCLDGQLGVWDGVLREVMKMTRPGRIMPF